MNKSKNKRSLYNTIQSNKRKYLVGPISGDKYQEIVFPLLSPDPATNKNVFFVKYPFMSELTAVVVKYIQQEIKQTTTYSMQ
jgi:hypothetical protein